MTAEGTAQRASILRTIANVGTSLAIILTLSGAAMITELITAALPGIHQPENSTRTAATIVLTCLTGFPAAIFCFQMATTGGQLTPSNFRAGAATFWAHVRTVFRILGFRRYPRGEVVRMLVVAAVFAAILVTVAVPLTYAGLPEGWAPRADDPRGLAAQQASPFVRVLNGLIFAPLPEEIAYRGPVVLAAGLLATRPGSQQIPNLARLLTLILVMVATAVLFAFAHSAYSGLNVALAGGMGAMNAFLAVRFRSIVPGVMLHAFYNGAVPLF